MSVNAHRDEAPAPAVERALAELRRASETARDAGAALQSLIRTLRRQPVPRVQLPAGDYRLRPSGSASRHCHVTNNDDGPRPIGLDLVGIRDVAIDAHGVRFLMSGHMNAVTLESCHNVTLRGLTVDWVEPLVAEAAVVGAQPGELRLALPTDVRHEVRGDDLWLIGDGWEKDARHLLCLDPATGGPARGTGDNLGSPWGTPFTFAEDGGDVLLRGGFGVLPTVGQVVVLNPHHRPAVAVHVRGGGGITLENVTIHASPGMAIVAEQVENLALRHCRVLPGKNRLVSANADATHCANCRGHVLLEDGHFEGQLDDPGNFHGMYVRLIRRVGGDGFVLRRVHFQQQGAEFARVGDQVRWLDPATLKPLGQGEVAEVNELDAKRLSLRLTRSLSDLPTDLAFENLAASPDVTVRGNRAGHNRARGFLMSTGGRCLVENNLIYSGGAGVQVHAGLGLWHESGAVADLTIRGNKFRGCTEGGWSAAIIDISAQPEGTGEELPLHHGIRVINNQVEATAAPLIASRFCGPIEKNGNVRGD